MQPRLLAAILVWRFLKTGGPETLRMMGEPAHEEGHDHQHDQADMEARTMASTITTTESLDAETMAKKVVDSE